MEIKCPNCSSDNYIPYHYAFMDDTHLNISCECDECGALFEAYCEFECISVSRE